MPLSTIPSVTEQDHQRETRIPAVQKTGTPTEKQSKARCRVAVFRASDPDRGTEVPRKDASSKTRAAAAESPEPALSNTVAISHPRCGESEKRCCASVKHTLGFDNLVLRKEGKISQILETLTTG